MALASITKHFCFLFRDDRSWSTHVSVRSLIRAKEDNHWRFIVPGWIGSNLSFFVRGFEDCRLFPCGEKQYSFFSSLFIVSCSGLVTFVHSSLRKKKWAPRKLSFFSRELRPQQTPFALSALAVTIFSPFTHDLRYSLSISHPLSLSNMKSSSFLLPQTMEPFPSIRNSFTLACRSRFSSGSSCVSFAHANCSYVRGGWKQERRGVRASVGVASFLSIFVEGKFVKSMQITRDGWASHLLERDQLGQCSHAMDFFSLRLTQHLSRNMFWLSAMITWTNKSFFSVYVGVVRTLLIKVRWELRGAAMNNPTVPKIRFLGVSSNQPAYADYGEGGGGNEQ